MAPNLLSGCFFFSLVCCLQSTYQRVKAIREVKISARVKASVFCLLLSALCCFIKTQAQPFTTKTGLFDQAQTDDVGLTKAAGTETVTIFSPTASTDHYSNAVVMIGFKGYLYCQWQSSATNEDSEDTWVAYSRGQNGTTWTSPMTLAPSPADGYYSSGGWWVNGDTLVAYINHWPATVSPRGGYTLCAKSVDGLKWSAIKPVLMKDGKAMNAIFEQDPHMLPGGRIINSAHFQPGLTASPIYTDDPTGTRGWVRPAFTNMAHTGDVTREIEPSLFLQSDGKVVMIFRDQTSTFYKLASVSANQGLAWTTPVLTDMPDSRAKQSAGNLPDGTAYMAHNPVTSKNRFPLAVVLSKDGKVFDKAYLLRAGGSELPALRYPGTAKTLGYSYPKSTVWQGYLYVAYSTNKEDVQYTRVPLSALSLNNACSGTIDQCDRCVGGATGKTACNAVGEAEHDACTFDGVIETKNAGFKGNAYINVDNAAGTSVQFSISAANAGTATLSFRYANGGTLDRPAQVTLNGAVLPGNWSFPVTGTFTDWKTADFTLTLLKGDNSIKLASATAEGLANIDQIGYVSAGLSNRGCLPTGLDEPDVSRFISIYPNPVRNGVSWNGDRKWHLEDLTGNILTQGEGHAADIAAYPNGMYVIRFEEGTSVKIIKE